MSRVRGSLGTIKETICGGFLGNFLEHAFAVVLERVLGISGVR
jgi:hypothetical protein